LVVDFSAVPFLDSTGANMIEGLAHKAHKHGVTLWLTGTTRDIRRVLLKHEIKRPLVRYAATVEAAISALQRARTTLRAGPTQAA
ncbi:STAS domain-containing protein, partial [Sinorhizobium medicae]|nr:STAS domain-containing protein [Sinorhizobium medicae]